MGNWDILVALRFLRPSSSRSIFHKGIHKAWTNYFRPMTTPLFSTPQKTIHWRISVNIPLAITTCLPWRVNAIFFSVHPQIYLTRFYEIPIDPSFLSAIKKLSSARKQIFLLETNRTNRICFALHEQFYRDNFIYCICVKLRDDTFDFSCWLNRRFFFFWHLLS